MKKITESAYDRAVRELKEIDEDRIIRQTDPKRWKKILDERRILRQKNKNKKVVGEILNKNQLEEFEELERKIKRDGYIRGSDKTRNTIYTDIIRKIQDSNDKNLAIRFDTIRNATNCIQAIRARKLKLELCQRLNVIYVTKKDVPTFPPLPIWYLRVLSE